MATVPASAGSPTITDFAGTTGQPSKLHINLLGGFRVKRPDGWLADFEWGQRRSARRLVKVLATVPDHALHRDQVLDMLWRESDPASALNSLAKALHAARLAIEPKRLPRQASTYLVFRDERLGLDSELVTIDADEFQRLARTALGSRSVTVLESALAAYHGELLPEDRYEDWTNERRRALASQYGQLMARLAEVHLARNELNRALERFREALEQDPTNEVLHRSVIRLHAEMGDRAKAIQQFQVCSKVLEQELGVGASRETEELYQEVLEDRVRRRHEQMTLTLGPSSQSPRLPAFEPDAGLVGRDRELASLQEALAHAQRGRGNFVVLTGCSGVGKTHLARSFLSQAKQAGVTCFRAAGQLAGLPGLPAGLLVEGIGHSRTTDPSTASWAEVVGKPLAVVRLAAAVGEIAPEAAPERAASYATEPDLADDLWSRLMSDDPVILELGDLSELSPKAVEVVTWLAHAAPSHPWLLLGTLESEWVSPTSGLATLIDSLAQSDLCRELELLPLSAEACRTLISSLLHDGEVEDLVIAHVTDLSLGYPLFVEGIVRAMKDRGEIELIDGRWRPNGMTGATPPVMGSLIRTRMKHMDETTNLILSLVSAGERGLDLRTLLGAAAIVRPTVGGEAVLASVDHVVQTKLVDRRGNVLAFRNPLMAQAWMREMSTLLRTQVAGVLSQLLQGEPEVCLGQGAASGSGPAGLAIGSGQHPVGPG